MPYFLMQAEIEYDDALSDNALFDVFVQTADEREAWAQGQDVLDDRNHPLYGQYPDAVNISVNALVDGPFDAPQSGNFVKVDFEQPQRVLLEAFGEDPEMSPHVIHHFVITAIRNDADDIEFFLVFADGMLYDEATRTWTSVGSDDDRADDAEMERALTALLTAHNATAASTAPGLAEAESANLYKALARACQAAGYVNERTYTLLHAAVATITTEATE